MNYLTAEGLQKIYGEKVLFDDLNLVVSAGLKVALVAKNGSGKTSLLKILTREDSSDGLGKVEYHPDIRVGYLKQEPEMDDNYTVLDEVLYSDNPILKAIQYYEQSLLEPENTTKMEKAVELMDSQQAWDYETKVKQILYKLNIQQLDQKIGLLSGGQKKRVALAKLLIEEPDLMILDEPTNHLDLDMIEWLEEFLYRQKVTIFMVTHDRYFLENICDQIYELEEGILYRYRGNYTDYLQKKQERQELQKIEITKAKSLFRKELDWLRRQPKARTTKSKARIDSAHQIKAVAKQRINDDQLELSVKIERLGSKIVELHNISKAYDDNTLFEKFNYKFKRGEKVGIVGKNGSGKSTFLNILTKELIPDTGKVVHGDTVHLGYYTQGGMQLKEGQRVIEVIREIADNIPMEGGYTLSAAQFLERFLFPRDMHFNHVSKLSGGERRRLYLMTVLMKNPNFLILDEPTNDLDILTLNVLEEFLLYYKGCVIIVSHDRYFMDKLVDHVFAFEGDGEIRDYPGNYTQYRMAWLKEQEIKASEKKTETVKTEIPAAPKKSKKLSYNEQREYFNLEKDIAKLEKQKKEIEYKLMMGDVDQDEMMKLSNEFGEIAKTIEEKEERWMELEEKLEELNS